MLPKIGVTLHTNTDLKPGAELEQIVLEIERLGYESVWLTDAFGREPFATAAWLLARTKRIGVGTGIANIYGRDASSAAQTLRTLGEFSGGRFVLGLGVSNEMVNDMRKAERVKPLAKLEDYLDQMSTALAVSAEGTGPVYVAAHGPKMQALVAAKADGIMTWVMPAAHTALTRNRVGPGPEICPQLPIILTTDADAARAIGRAYIPVWLQLPSYQAAWRESGMSDDDFTNGGSDRLIDAIFAWGDPAAIRERIAEYGRAGATHMLIETVRAVDVPRDHPLKGQETVEADWAALEALAPVLLA